MSEPFFFTQEPQEYDRTVCSLGERYALAHQVQNLLAVGAPSVKAAARPVIVDLGCGTAADGVELSTLHATVRYLGIDFSPEMLAFARAKIESCGRSESVAFRCIDFRQDRADWLQKEVREAFGETLATAVICSFALHHYSAAEKALVYRAAWSALQTGGVLVVTDLASANLDWIAKLLLDRELVSIDQLSEPAAADALPGAMSAARRWFDHYQHENQPLALDADLKLIYEAGFSRGEVAYRDGQIAVVAAIRR